MASKIKDAQADWPLWAETGAHVEVLDDGGG
jgi:hypothetical protein